MDNQTTPTGVRTEKVKGAITLDRIFSGDFEKKDKVTGKVITKTAEIRQIITTKSFYPSQKVESNMQNGLFGSEAFGIAPQVFDSLEQRVSWIPVPVNMSEELVKQALANDVAKGATIYKVLSNAPILDENQEYSISAGQKTKDDYANAQVVRYPEGAVDKDGNDASGKLILDKNGNPQYRRTYYWKTPKEDIDLRGTSEVYLSTEIAVELKGASVLAGQTIG